MQGKRGCPFPKWWGPGKWRRSTGELLAWTVGVDYKVTGCPEALLTEERAEQIGVWSTWKRLGAPMDGGWATWPARLVDLITAVEAEENRLTAEKMKPEE